MKHALTALFAVGFGLAAQAFPAASSDPVNIQLNAWNDNLTAAKAKAKSLNRPALMVIADSVNCAFSKKFGTSILDSPQWPAFIEANPMVLILADKTFMTSSTFFNYARPYATAGIIYYPTVVLFRPDGTVADWFVARSALGANPGFYNRVKNTTDLYPNTTPPDTPTPGTIGFSVSSVSVSEGNPTVSVTVARQGGSSGAQTFSYATADGTAHAGVNFIGKSGSLAWADGNASAATVSVQLVNDNHWTSPTARTFTLSLARTSGTATLGTSLLTVTVNEVSPPVPASTAPAFTTPLAGATVSAVLNSAASITALATGSATISYAAAGLPAGLSINTATGLISGTPTVAGNSAVTVTASNGAGSATRSFTLRVAAPLASAAGSYKGFCYEPDSQQTVRGTLTLAATTSGTLRALVALDGLSYTFTGAWQPGTGYAAALHSNTSSETLDLQVDGLGLLAGTLGDAALFGRRVSLAGVDGFTGYYTSILNTAEATPNSIDIDNQPAGSGYLTFTVSRRGAVSYKGALADGTLFSGSSTLLTYSGAELAELGYADVAEDRGYACFPVYTLPYSRRGVVAAQIWIDGDLSATSEDNKVFIMGSGWLYPGKSASSPDDGFSATLDNGAFTEIGAAFVKPEDLAAVFEGTSLQTDCGSAPVQASGLSIKLPADNPLKATLTASTSTGLFSGKLLYSPDSGVPYTVKYAGVLVPALGLGGGYYLATDTSFPGYSVRRSKPVVIAP